jgi:hypothetical protein
VDGRELPASVGQRLLWLMAQYRGHAVLNCPLVCRIRGPFDPAQLAPVLGRLIERHDTLRTTIHRVGRRLVQRVHEPGACLPIASNGFACEPVAPDAIPAALRQELRTPLDPEIAPVRVRVWRPAPDDHLLCLNVHHLVTDAWSGAVLFREMATLLADGPARAVLPRVGWQYSDFVRWQEQFLQGPDFERQRAYWARQLDGATPPAIGPESPADPASSRPTASQKAALPADAVAAINAWAHGHRTTLFVVLLAIYYLSLHQETDQTDLAVASVFANRLNRDLRDTVGFIANPVVLRVQLDPAATFASLVQATHATVTAAFIHQAVPFHLVPSATGAARRRADDVVFQMMPAPMQPLRGGSLGIEPLVADDLASRFGLELAVIARGPAADAVLFYEAGRFGDDWARAFVRRFVSLVATIATDPQARLTSLMHNRRSNRVVP